MNPTNFECPTDISMLVTTDYRPSKALYVNVKNNNDFRSYMQKNGAAIKHRNLQNYVQAMYCSCEPSQWSQQMPPIPPFDTSKLDSIIS